MPRCGEGWRAAGGGDISDRAHRYRAQQCAPRGRRARKLCGSTRFLVVDHEDGDEWNDRAANLRWLCKSCNTALGIAMKRSGRGRRTRQYNAGARTLAGYVSAAAEHTRGAHDHGGKIIHETPKAKRREFARQIWLRRQASMQMKPNRSRFPFVVFNRKGNPIGEVSFGGKTMEAAKRSGQRILSELGITNAARPRPNPKPKRRRAAPRRVAPRRVAPRRKRKPLSFGARMARLRRSRARR